MTAFIRQEALEKAREIQIKADEEFAIEKSKLVRQESAAIDTQYEKKFKQAAMSQQITRSTLANKTRLKVLSARQELLDDLFDKARGRLGETAKDKSKYQETVKNLILEGAYALNEDKIHVRARKGDYEVVRKAIENAQKEYNDNLHKDVTVDIDEKNPQPDGMYVHPYHLAPTTRALLTCLSVRVASPSSAEAARLTSTTPLKSVSSSSKVMPYQRCGRHYSGTMKIVDSTIEFSSPFVLSFSCLLSPTSLVDGLWRRGLER